MNRGGGGEMRKEAQNFILPPKVSSHATAHGGKRKERGRKGIFNFNGGDRKH